jgi:RNA polymerase sigma factor (sigma-70 family)
LTDLEIIQGIKNQDPKVLKYLYHEYYSLVQMNIMEYGGTKADVKDVFQEAIILIYRKINEGSFQMKTSFKNYLLSTSWYIWVKELRTKNHQSRIIESYNYFQDDYYYENNIEEEEYELHRRYKIYQENFKKLTKKCRKILKMFLDKKPIKEIAKKVGLSENSVKKRKYECKERLTDLIKNDNRFDRDNDQ